MSTAPAPGPVDRFGRRFRNLRVSLTAACNYACTYCVPDGKRLLRADRELDAEQMLRAIELLVAGAGIDRLRLTGGEPLVTPKFDYLFPRIMDLGLKDVSLTTNGQLLGPKVPLLVASGLKRINISLDTLDPKAFRPLARGGDLATVLAAVDACLEAGLKVKLNMVPVRSSNRSQIQPLLSYALDRGMELRYIELMRMGHLSHSAAFDRDFIGMEEILALIGEHHSFERTQAPFDSTARRFAVAGGGTFGIIPNETEPFCSSCTRLRLSSEGDLYGCLSSSAHQALRPLLALPREEALAQLPALLEATLKAKQPVAFTGGTMVMKFIGG